MTRHGNYWESTARDRYLASTEVKLQCAILKMQHGVEVHVRVVEYGLVVLESTPIFAVSPDGVTEYYSLDSASNEETVLERRALEIKCPFHRSLMQDRSGAQKRGAQFSMPNSSREVPSYYMDQIQGVMNVMELALCDFVQYLPEKGGAKEVLNVVSIRRDSIYWTDVLQPKALTFYNSVYIPALLFKLNGAAMPMDLD